MAKLSTMVPAVRLAVSCVILSLGIRTWVVMGLIDPVTVAGRSMAPTLSDGDHLWIDRTAFQRRAPRRWEVVIAINPTDGGELCVKRIVGLPGESIAIADGRILINGQPLSNHDDSRKAATSTNFDTPWRVPQWHLAADEYFLLGDNSAVSLDSRVWGPVPARLFIGKPLLLGTPSEIFRSADR